MAFETFSYRLRVPSTIPAAEPAERPRILIADPDELGFGYLSAALQAAGYVADAVPSGYALLEKVRKEPVHLVALALNLSDMTAAAAIERVREIGPARPVVLLAHRGAFARHGLLRDSAAACLVKPVDPAEFVGICRRVLGFSRRNR
jgi:DNA-binding response OmpR family regulator